MFTQRREFNEKKEDGWELTFVHVGASKDDIDVKVSGDNLVIDVKENEFEYGFTRKYKLPQGAEEVSAKYENGLLVVNIKEPKGFTKDVKVKWQ